MPIPGNLLSATTEMVDPNTSGWTPKLNCQPLVKGTGGRNGDGCLVTKSVAVGEVQARTVSSYPVTAGTTYHTFADSAGTVPERIGIRWLNAAGTEISITWSLTTVVASGSWHRVSVAGAAPTGATRAQVVLSSTETAVGTSHYWENVYLGLPIRTTGNLFGFGTESFEIDASMWTPAVNSTIARQVPVITWAVDSYLGGGHVLAMTATAAGNASITAADKPSVTPGTEYLAYAYLQPPTTGSSTWIELRFFDAADVQIGVQRSTLAPPGTGMYRQRVSMVAPPTATTCTVAAGVDGASAGQTMRVETVVVMVAPKLQAGTVIPYADGSFEQGLAGWTKTAGVATIARSSPWGAAAQEGYYSMTVTSPTATASTIQSGRFPITGGAGVNWRAQIHAASTSGTWTMVSVKIRWYDAANNDLGVSTGNNWAFPSAGSWYALTTDALTPVGAAQAAIEIAPTAATAGASLVVDSVALWQVLPLTEVTAYPQDGYAQIVFRELSLDWKITVLRQTADGHKVPVRGTSGLIVQQPVTSDLIVIEDHEAPLNTPVRYILEYLQLNGAVATRTTSYVTVDLADPNEAWLKDPGNPQRNLRVVVETAPNWQRPIEQTAYIVKGRRTKVVLSGTRQGLEGELAVWTRTDEERRALHLLLDSGNVLLWQAVPGMGVDDMYVNVGAIDESRIANLATEKWRTWKLPLIEADQPATTGVNGSGGRTWLDVIAEFATCADLLPVYETCEALLLDRRTG